MAQEYYETVIGLNIAGNYAALVQHWGADITGGETAFETAQDIVQVAMQTAGAVTPFLQALADIMGDDCFVSSARSRRVNLGGGATAVTGFAAADFPGAYGGDVDGAQIAGFAIGFPDLNGGRFAKNWIPGVSEDALIAGRFTDAYKGAFEIYLNEWLNGLPGNYTYLPYLKYGSPVASYTQIVSAQLGSTPGTIRRRLVPV